MNQLVTVTASTFRLADSLRESERLKGQIEEREREIALLKRNLKVIFCKLRSRTRQICAAEQMLF